MQFNSGDHVVHSRFGIGTVVAIEERKFPEEKAKLFYRVDFNEMTVWVPLESHREGPGLRPITRKSDLEACKAVLKSPPSELSHDFRERQTELEERLKPGTLRAYCEVVRDLSARGQEANLSKSDLDLFRKTRDAVVAEWAATEEIQLEEASRQLDQILVDKRG